MLDDQQTVGGARDEGSRLRGDNPPAKRTRSNLDGASASSQQARRDSTWNNVMSLGGDDNQFAKGQKPTNQHPYALPVGMKNAATAYQNNAIAIPSSQGQLQLSMAGMQHHQQNQIRPNYGSATMDQYTPPMAFQTNQRMDGMPFNRAVGYSAGQLPAHQRFSNGAGNTMQGGLVGYNADSMYGAEDHQATRTGMNQTKGYSSATHASAYDQPTPVPNLATPQDVPNRAWKRKPPPGSRTFQINMPGNPP